MPNSPTPADVERAEQIITDSKELIDLRNMIATALAAERQATMEQACNVVLNTNLPFGRENQLLNEIVERIRAAFAREEK